MYKRVQLVLAVLLLMAAGCQETGPGINEIPGLFSPEDYYIGQTGKMLKSAELPLLISEQLDIINVRLASKNEIIRIASAEYITLAGREESGHKVLSKIVGNKQLEAGFVPGDNRRAWSTDTKRITYAIDQTDGVPSGGMMSATEAGQAIDRAFQTWEDVKSTDLGITKMNAGNVDLGFVAFMNPSGSAGSQWIAADIQMAGWGDIDFEGNILAVTFTFIFTDNDGTPSDLDNNRKMDVAFREIYFDPSWQWADGGMHGIDLQSIALHEIGHGLSQGHFGTTFLDKEGNLHVTPRAVMNPFYTGTFRNLQKTDIGGHSSIWANWPAR